MNISVVMATYNGEKYIREQLDSILCQLDSDDEIIISDDGSKDKTCEIIKLYQQSNSNIKLFHSNHLGTSQNFLNAILRAENDIIVLSDQDDIWMPTKIQKTKEFFELNERKMLLTHRLLNVNSEGKLIDDMTEMKLYHGYLRNLIKSCFWGCTMAFRKEFISAIANNNKVIAHDQYIGLIAEKYKVSGFYKEVLIKHRIHDVNVTKRLSLLEKLKFRLNLFRNTFF